MNEIKDLVDTVLKNRSLTVFLAIVVVALFFGWIGG
jgi:multidrug efflux pump subunit AcrB